MEGLLGYASSDSVSSDGQGQAQHEEEGGGGDPLNLARPPNLADSDADDASPSTSTRSDDSAAARAAAAAARLACLDKESAAAEAAVRPVTAALPDPLATLGSTTGAPAFLRPEAMRPLAAPAHKGGAGLVIRPAVEPPPAKRQRPATDAPRPQPPAASAASAAVEAAPWAAAAASDEAALAAAKGVPIQQQQHQRGKATGSMPVAEALASGAALPRKGQGMKERQKAKADAGQRATGDWKPEAFMILRQQYD